MGTGKGLELLEQVEFGFEGVSDSPNERMQCLACCIWHQVSQMKVLRRPELLEQRVEVSCNLPN